MQQSLLSGKYASYAFLWISAFTLSYGQSLQGAALFVAVSRRRDTDSVYIYQLTLNTHIK